MTDFDKGKKVIQQRKNLSKIWDQNDWIVVIVQAEDDKKKWQEYTE